jgi:SPP1 gp7 family putative phage head morphogenesis protein
MATKRNARAWLHPDTAERNYQRMLVAYVDEFTKDSLAYLKELELLRNDGWSDDFTAAILYLLERALGMGQRVTARLPEVYAQVNQFNDRQFRLVVKAGTGLEIGPSGAIPAGAQAFGNVSAPGVIRARFGVGVDVYRSEPWLAARQTNWVAANTALIKSIPAQHMERVEQIVRNGVLQGESPRSLAAKIQEAGGVTKRRAMLIASDQIGKANAELTQYRQTELGIKEYEWVDSHDERVRPLHRVYNGQIFSWDKPPADGHPGYAVKCRCRASPRFPEDAN